MHVSEAPGRLRRVPRTLITTPPARRLILVVAALAATAGLSACQVASPITTAQPYDPADGVSLDTEEVSVRDLLVVSEGNGTPGVIVGYVVNNSEEPLSVEVALVEDGTRTVLTPAVEIAADSAGRLDGRAAEGEFVDPVIAAQIPGLPGGLVDLRITTSTGEATSTSVPVLPPDGVYANYAELLGGGDAATATE